MTTKVLFVDIDSSLPNLALMQYSAYLKKKGFEVGFDIDDPDVISISCLFKKNAAQVRGIEVMYPQAFVEYGGPGVDMHKWLPKGAKKIMPDYSLYDGKICTKCKKQLEYCRCKGGGHPGDINFSMGFTTRGCIRRCPWCVVWKKEPKFERWMHVREFHNPEFEKVMFMDNNILADKEWFMENTKYVLDHNLKLHEHGMDIRLLDYDIAERLMELDYDSILKFAWDWPQIEESVREGIKILDDVGFNLRRKVMFYVLVGFNTTPEQDKHRCRVLKELGTNPYVMQYKRNDWTRKLAGWANVKKEFWKMDIDEYER